MTIIFIHFFSRFFFLKKCNENFFLLSLYRDSFLHRIHSRHSVGTTRKNTYQRLPYSSSFINSRHSRHSRQKDLQRLLCTTGKKMRMMSAFHMYTVDRCAIPMIQMLWSSHCTRSVITIPIFGDRNNHVDRSNSRETGKRKYQDDPIAA